MGRKPGTSPTQALVKQQPTSPFPQAITSQKAASNNPSTPTTSDTAGEQRNPAATNGSAYYDASAGTAAPYPALSYGDQASNGAGAHTSTNDIGVGGAFDSADTTQYMYAANSAVSAATGPAVSPAMEQAASAPNPLIAFASQATQHVAGEVGDEWRHQPPPPTLMSQHNNSSNTWHDWTAAIADSQDRYSASALLTLGGSRPAAEVGVGATVEHVPNQGGGLAVGVAAGSHAAGQWPLLLFHDGTTQA